MGLFSRKKKIEVPIPPSDNILKFPKPVRVERIIKPEIQEEQSYSPPPQKSLTQKSSIPPKIKEAVGLEKTEVPEITESAPSFPQKTSYFTQRPFFLRVQHYQQLLENLDSIKSSTNKLNTLNQDLEKSEFNENKDYERLKNDLKRTHSRLLLMDSLIFKK